MAASPMHPGAEAPHHMQLIQIGTAFWASRVVYVAARLGLADHLADGPLSAKALAEKTSSHPSRLHRLLRALAGLGVVSHETEDAFALTPMGHALRTGAPGAARASILAFGGQWGWRAWEEFPATLAHDTTAMERAWGKSVFEFLGENPEEASHFSEAMVGFHGHEPPAVAAAYDFSAFDTIVDVGGATGNMLCAILARYEKPRGILFDLPHVVADAPGLLAERGLDARIEIKPGSFFDSVPEGGNAYVLSHVIHDWNEEQCLAILENCRRAMRPGAKLLLVEMLLPPDNTPHPGRMLDMVMMALPGGQERTAEEYADLLAKAGFAMTRVIATESAASIIEADLA